VSPHARRARDAGLLTILLLASVFYVWTAAPSHSRVIALDRYNQLTDAFAHGQLSLLQRPTKRITGLPNPYDPRANYFFRVDEGVSDLSLYRDKLYAYWGPTPVLVLFWPARAFGKRITEPFAMEVFCILGVIALLGLLRLAVTRLAPRTPAWMEMFAAVVLAVSTLAPFNLRNPGVYQVAISAGFAFLFLGVLALAGGLAKPRWSIALFALGSLSLGLAGGARPPLWLAGAGLLLVGWTLSKRRALNVRMVLALALPFVVCAIAQGVYNDLRFDSALEFGQRYVLGGPELDVTAVQRAANLAPGVFYYLLAPVYLQSSFPFLSIDVLNHGQYPGHLPPGYTIVERTGGLINGQPLIVLLPLFGVLIARRRRLGRAIGPTLTVLGGVGVAIMALDAYAVPGTSMRYETDFLPLLLVATLLAWLLLGTRLPPGPTRAAVRASAAVLAVPGLLFGLALSITGYEGVLAQVRPHTFESLARFFRPLSHVADQFSWFLPGEQWRTLGILLAAIAALAALTWFALFRTGTDGSPARTAGRATAALGAGLLLADWFVLRDATGGLDAPAAVLFAAGLALVTTGLAAASFGRAESERRRA